ncbi:MAG: 2'-5' RNA ligase family protein [Caldilineaceae bacterium]
MGYAVELDFDAESAAAITALTATIYDTCGGLHLTGIGHRPHLSLAVFDSIVPARLESILQHLAQTTAPFVVQVAAVGTFPGPQGVVFLAPVVSATLLAVHTSFHDQLATAGLAAHSYYRPGNWVPHCTVGMELTPPQVVAAVGLCRVADIFRPLMVTAIRLIEFRPVETLGDYPLRTYP